MSQYFFFFNLASVYSLPCEIHIKRECRVQGCKVEKVFARLAKNIVRPQKWKKKERLNINNECNAQNILIVGRVVLTTPSMESGP